jgi:CMP-N-acetylneuraminic acid synthetase
MGKIESLDIDEETDLNLARLILNNKDEII